MINRAELKIPNNSLYICGYFDYFSFLPTITFKLSEAKQTYLLFMRKSFIGMWGMAAVLSFGMMLSACGSKETDAVDSTEVITEEVVETEELPAAEPTEEEISDFVKEFRKNLKFSDWIDDGWEVEEENSGVCHLNITNNNPVEIDGDDYYISFRYEYLYGEGVYEGETVKKSGVTIAPGNKGRINYFYTDDCGPLKPKVNFKMTDRQLYDKYHR